jgi:PAS domain S-box-containing protein
VIQIDWWGLWRAPFLDLPPRQFEGYLLLALYGLVLIAALVGTMRSWTRLPARRWLLFAVLCVLVLLLNNVLAWHYPIARPPVPNRPQEASSLSIPLLGSLPILLVGGWVGIGPAMVAGLLAGLMRALFINNGQMTEIFHSAFFGLIAGYLLQQNYRGRLSSTLRQPIVVGVLGRLLLWFLALPATFVYAPIENPLSALDYSWPLFLSALLPALVEGVIAGVLGQLLYAALPTLRPTQTTRAVPPPYARSLNRRLLFTFVPIVLLIIAVLVYAVATTTVGAATQQAIQQMARDAGSASQDIPFFFQTGQSLLSSLADDERLHSPDANIRQGQLAEGVRTVAFFDEMVLIDASGQPLNFYPASAQKQLTDEEKLLVTRAISSTAPGVSEVHRRDDNTLMVSFVVPVDDGSGGANALIGRARLNVNPTMTRVLSGLQNTLGTGEGFVVDERSRIVLSPRADQLMTDWRSNTGQVPITQIGGGQVYINSVEDGTRRLIYVRPVDGYPWTTVIELPYSSVLGLAAQVSVPLLLLLLALMVVAGVVMFLVSGAVTRPVRALSRAAARIAEGRLEEAVQVSGEGEVGQLSDVFEQMRASLKGRLDDLSLLLRVSQEVAASLDLERGIPPILEGALQTTGALAARLVLVSADDQPREVWRRGELPSEIMPLDQRLVELAKSSPSPLLVESVARVRSTLNPSIIPVGVRALAALPVRRPNETLGVLWLAYGESRRFMESEKNVMATLAGQAAILVENAQLFQAAESERRRLAAILTSTTDAVIVTSQDGRVLLMNSAAEIAFGIVATRVVGKRLQETVLEPAVIQLLATTNPEGGAQTGEIILPDGHTLYGSASDILMGDGPPLGRVAVLRDITHFKELDSMKSDFVATVSHDLRSPLTYMRGYASMLPMVGELSDRQKDYVEKIQGGIEQMTEMVDDLLDLGRIEAGVGLQRAECVVADLVREIVEDARGRALAFNLDLRTEINTSRPMQADQALLKRAISNLLDNAMKYTPPGGKITLGLDERADSLIVHVSDTGIGIAAADQGRLFEKFYRVKRRDTLDIKGSGLGLAIVKSIAEWHGGRVWVDSQLGVGSTFYLALPVK